MNDFKLRSFWLFGFLVWSALASGADSPVDDVALKDLGSLSFPNSGAAAAQAPFLKGVAALHSFWFDEAADFFQEAQKVDPNFALAFWGEAMTYHHPLWDEQDRDAALEALNRLAPHAAARAAKAPTAREKAWLAAVEILFGDGDIRTREKQYAQAMAQLSQTYPDDFEAAAFHAVSLMGMVRASERDFTRMYMRSAAISERLFRMNPNHPGVLHYLIHAYDDPIHAPLGLPYAERYASVAPAAHHARHMPSHIFLQLGMWDRVIASNTDSYQASVDWVKRRNLSLAKRDFHSLTWLHYGYLQEGKLAKAQETIEIAASGVTESGGDRARATKMIMSARQLLISPEFADHGLTLESVNPTWANPAGTAALLALGFHAARSGELETAATCQKRLEDLGREPGDSTTNAEYAREAGIMAIELDALISFYLGNREQAESKSAAAADLEREAPTPQGPVTPIKPALELQGDLLLLLEKPRLALAAYDASLLRTPNRPASMLGKARAHAKLGETEAAGLVFGQLARIWNGADPDFPGLQEVKAYLPPKGS